MNVLDFDTTPQVDSPRRRLLLHGIAVALTVPLASCAGGAELFVPYFVFTFDGTTQGQTVSFFFDTEDPSNCSESGRIGGSSGVTVNGGGAGNRFDVTGTFSGRRLDIAIAAPPAFLAATYTGQFIDDATVSLTPAGGAGLTFNIKRTQPRDASCPASR
ncbi:MAG: hypothetical protein Q8K96_13750 [Rubrivivax sp.]|nr:hypothetical protein [Rubrivivax sp.]